MGNIVLKNVSKSFGVTTIIPDIDLQIEDGEFVVFVGPSGCGKSTLLRLIAGLEEVTSGAILIDGRDVTNEPPARRKLAMVFQSYALYPHMTVARNIAFPLKMAGESKDVIDRKVADAARILNLTNYLDRRPGQLSGGQRQRVAIGRALVKNVGVFLFDEPLSNLDAKLRTEMRLEIKKLHDQLKSTIVYVTHDQIEAMTMATKIAVMNGGVIQQFGTPDEIYERPANLFVASFIGSPAMNLRKTRLAVSGGKAEAIFGSGVRMDVSDYPFAETPQDGAEAIVGLRPEHFALEAKGPVAATFTVPVQYAERTGPDASAYFQFEDDLLALRVAPDAAAKLAPRQAVAVSYLKGKANLFDARTGHRM